MKFAALTHLPRETRDTLFLLVVIGWVVLKWTILAALGFFAVLIAERVF